MANDLGEALECGAYLKNLRRTAYGPFTIDGALSFENTQSAIEAGRIDTILHPIDTPLCQLEKQTLNELQSLQIVQGHDIQLSSDSPYNKRIRVYNHQGKFLAVMKFVPHTGLWHPEKVFDL